jgi:hypothetical protein
MDPNSWVKEALQVDVADIMSKVSSATPEAKPSGAAANGSAKPGTSGPAATPGDTTVKQVPPPPAAKGASGKATPPGAEAGTDAEGGDADTADTKGSSKVVTAKTSLIGGPGQVGVVKSKIVEAEQDRGHGLSTSQSVEFGGKVKTGVEEIPDTSPPRYKVTVTIDLSAGGKVGAERKKDEGAGGGLSASASGSLTMSKTHVMTGPQKDAYLKAIKTGAGGATEELRVAQMVARGQLEAARAYLTGGKTSAAEDAKRMADGDEETITASGSAGAKAGIGGSSDGSKLGAEVGLSHSEKLTITQTAKDGKVLVTVSVSGETTKSVGGSMSEGVAGMGVSHEGGDKKGKSVTFVLDPKDPKFNSLYDQIKAVHTLDELTKLAASKPELKGATTTSQGKSSMLTTTATVAGVGLSVKQGGEYSEEETVDDKGVSHKYEGSGTLGGSLSVAGKKVAGSSTTDKFSGEAGPDNKGSGETSSTHSEIDYGSSISKLGKSFIEKPIGTVTGVVSGETKVLKENTEVEGKKLTDDSFSRLAELAKDPGAWQKSWHGNVDTFVDWEKTRKKVLAANGDRAQIEKALAEFESADSGRSKTVENAVSDTGIAFDFPDELADQKPVYDELVAGSPVEHARGLATAGKQREALDYISKSQDKLGHLEDAIRSHQTQITPAALAEMLRRISSRRAELRTETHQLSAPPKAQAKPAGPDGAAAAQQQAAADAERESAVKREELKAKADEMISNLRAYRSREQANFAEIQKEVDKENSFFSKPDVIRISTLLNDLKAMYAEWDKVVEDLKGVLKEAGGSPDQAAQYAPDRARWNAIHAKEFPW